MYKNDYSVRHSKQVYCVLSKRSCNNLGYESLPLSYSRHGASLSEGTLYEEGLERRLLYWGPRKICYVKL